MEINETKKIYITSSTDDKKEGKAIPYFWLISESITTAERLGKKRYTNKSDFRVSSSTAVKINNQWYAPCRIHEAMTMDIAEDKILERWNLAIKKARDLGLSTEDIETLTWIGRIELLRTSEPELSTKEIATLASIKM